MSDSTKLFVAVFISVNFSVLMTLFAYKLFTQIKAVKKQKKINHFGDSAEIAVENYIKKYFPSSKIMKELYLKTPNGLTELDMLLLCGRGIFIIEIKSHNGYIVTRGKHWTQRWKDKVVRFHNPTYQNKIHKKALEDILNKRQSLASLPIYTVAVFTSPKVTFSENVKDVIRLSLLSKYIKNKPIEKRMTADNIENIEKLINCYMETSTRRKRKHQKRIWKNNSKKAAYRVNKFSVK